MDLNFNQMRISITGLTDFCTLRVTYHLGLFKHLLLYRTYVSINSIVCGLC